jgi:hypothetical protein
MLSARGVLDAGFTAASLEQLAERNIEATDVADAVYGETGRQEYAGRGVVPGNVGS